MGTVIIPQKFKATGLPPDRHAVKLVGMLVLERCPASVIFEESLLYAEYPAALQEFKDMMLEYYKEIFIEPMNFQADVISEILFYLERKGMIS